MSAPEVPTGLPSYLVAGADWRWDAVLYDQASGDVFAPDDGGTVTMRLLGHYSLEFNATGNTTDDVWEFRVTAATTDDITPVSKADQSYEWRIFGTLSGVTYDLGSGSIFVYANPDVVAGDDRRTFAQTALPLLKAEYLARVGGTAGTGHNRYALLGREIEKWSPAEIRAEISAMERLIERDRFGRPRPVKFGFRHVT